MDTETIRARARANQRDKAAERRSYRQLLDAIWEAADGGVRQGDIVRASGLTRERIRQVCRPDYRQRRQEEAGQ